MNLFDVFIPTWLLAIGAALAATSTSLAIVRAFRGPNAPGAYWIALQAVLSAAVFFAALGYIQSRSVSLELLNAVFWIDVAAITVAIPVLWKLYTGSEMHKALRLAVGFGPAAVLAVGIYGAADSLTPQTRDELPYMSMTSERLVLCGHVFFPRVRDSQDVFTNPSFPRRLGRVGNEVLLTVRLAPLRVPAKLDRNCKSLAADQFLVTVDDGVGTKIEAIDDGYHVLGRYGWTTWAWKVQEQDRGTEYFRVTLTRKGDPRQYYRDVFSTDTVPSMSSYLVAIVGFVGVPQLWLAVTWLVRRATKPDRKPVSHGTVEARESRETQKNAS